MEDTTIYVSPKETGSYEPDNENMDDTKDYPDIPYPPVTEEILRMVW